MLPGSRGLSWTCCPRRVPDSGRDELGPAGRRALAASLHRALAQGGEGRSPACRSCCNRVERRDGRLSRELVFSADAETQPLENDNFAALSLMLWAKLVYQETCHAADLPGLLVVETEVQGAGFCF